MMGLKQWMLKKSIKSIDKGIARGKMAVAISKDDKIKEKNINKLKEKYIESIEELEEFFELEKETHEMSLTELDETLNKMIQEIIKEYKIKMI